MDTVKKISYYLVLPLAIILGSILIFWKYCYSGDIEKSLGSTQTLVQTAAILIGGLWAYRKLGWEKRAESAIKIKAALMEYSAFHNEMARIYRVRTNEQDEPTAYVEYAVNMHSVRNPLNKEIHLLCYLPKKLRKKIFDLTWLTAGNVHGANREKLDENWKKFGEKLEKIYTELDNLVLRI